MKAKVQRARQQATERNKEFGCVVNRDLPATMIVAASGLSSAAFAATVNEVIPRSASNRSVLRSLRVARTLADVHERESICLWDVAQAWRWQAEEAAHERGEMVRSLD
jgi:predicted ATPase with chaperone activity